MNDRNQSFFDVLSRWMTGSKVIVICLKWLFDPRMWLLRALIGLALLVFISDAIVNFSDVVYQVNRILAGYKLFSGFALVVALVVCCCLFHRRKEIHHWALLLDSKIVHKAILTIVLLLLVSYMVMQQTSYDTFVKHTYKAGLIFVMAWALGFYIFRRRKEISHWFSLIEGSVIQKVITSMLLLLCLVFTLTQKTIYPITHVGMFEESFYSRLTKDTQIEAPAMYCHYVDGKFRVESIRRASFFFPGDLDLDCHIYLGMIYFKWRHTEYVNDIIIKAAQREGLKLAPMDLVYSLGEDVHIISKTQTQLSTSKTKNIDGRAYMQR